MNYLQALTNAPDKAAVADANFEKLDTEILRATATLNFGSINGGAQEELTIAVTGAVANDIVCIGAPAALEAGIVITGFVSAAGTVTIRASNVTGSPVNPASATYNVIVLRY